MMHPSRSPREGIFDPASDPLEHQGLGGDPREKTMELLDVAHRDPVYRKFLTHPALREFVRHFMNWEQEVLIKRALLRHNCPGSHSSPVHYDQMFLRAGEPEFLTAWLSVGDCAPNGGGLMYLENSSQLGEDIEAEFARNAQVLSPEERLSVFNRHMAKDGYLTHDAEEFGRVKGNGKLRWLVGDYEAGDVLFHKPYVIHASTRNEDPEGRIRLSSDLRFYRKGAMVDERWDNIFKHDDGLS